jgi:double-stranded uracil-DNA glycosylase
MDAFKPTKEELIAAYGKSVPDVIAPNLRVLFCGINPGLYSGATGHHFARPGNRFWPVLHAALFTDRLLSPFEDQELLKRGYGITNIANRTTANAAELSLNELREGAERVKKTVLTYKPRIVAVLGIEAYRKAFGRKDAILGPQEEGIGDSAVWVLPNPSGLNAHYQLKDLADLFERLLEASQKIDALLR